MKNKFKKNFLLYFFVMSVLAFSVFALSRDFSVSLNQSSGSVVQGSSVNTLVTVTLLHSPNALVSLSSSGCPPSSTCTFSPSSGTPSFTSTFSIATSTSTPAGNYPITVKGTSTSQSGGSLTRTAQYNLTVTSLPPPPLCTRNNPSVIISPFSQSAPAGNLRVYTTSVTNWDSAACGNSTFDLSSSIPLGWIGIFSANSLTIDPGASNSANFYVTAANSSLPGNYSFTNTATNRANSSFSWTTIASYVVS